MKFIFNKLALIGYKNASKIISIGPAMTKHLLENYKVDIADEIYPWAIDEPSNLKNGYCDEYRKQIYGDSKVAILLSGSYGRAHSFQRVLELIRYFRANRDFHFCISISGSSKNEVLNKITDDDFNVTISEFVPNELLQKHLSSADINIVSLKNSWSSYVVPSKFFGSLASGSPVLYSGDKDSDISIFINRYNIGKNIEHNDFYEIEKYIYKCTEVEYKQYIFKTYHDHFSRNIMIDKWKYQIKIL